MLEQGPTEKAIIDACIRERRPLPAAILNAPALELGLELYYAGFMDLTTDRSIGYGEGPIPWSSVERYCDRHDIDDEQREDFHYHVRRLDNAYLEHRAKQSKVESKATAKSASKRPARR